MRWIHWVVGARTSISTHWITFSQATSSSSMTVSYMSTRGINVELS